MRVFNNQAGLYFRIFAALFSALGFISINAEAQNLKANSDEFNRAYAAIEEKYPELIQNEVPATSGTGRWFKVGNIVVAPPDTPASGAEASDETAEELYQEPTLEEKWFAVDDLVKKERYLVYSPEPAVSGLINEQIFEIEGNDPIWTDSDELVEKGWSDNTGDDVGDDNRVDASGFDYNQITFYKAIGYLSTGCTATMLRQTSNGTFALTAAHCVYDNDGNPIGASFYPAYGNAAYAGGWSTNHIYIYSNWKSNECYVGYSQTESCRQYDIALLRLTQWSGTTYIGGVSFGSFTKSQIESKSYRFQAGYPLCLQAGSPSGCSGHHLWGDWAHSVGNFRKSDRLFDHSSDTCSGHSGAPMRYYDSNVFGYYTVYGVHSGEHCAAACNNDPDQPRVNMAVRMTNDWTSYLYDIMWN